jgi:hypothetical protein
MAITSYELLASTSPDGLTAKLATAIAANKQPFGMPFSDGEFFCQAVIEGSQVLVGDTGAAGADGADGVVDYSGLATVLDALPTSDPADGTYWLNSGVVTKGTGP